jgi:hypothetical protein
LASITTCTLSTGPYLDMMWCNCCSVV